jgi:hypothetical protein
MLKASPPPPHTHTQTLLSVWRIFSVLLRYFDFNLGWVILYIVTFRRISLPSSSSQKNIPKVGLSGADTRGGRSGAGLMSAAIGVRGTMQDYGALRTVAFHLSGASCRIYVPHFTLGLLFYTEDRGSTLHRSVGKYLPRQTASHLRSRFISCSFRCDNSIQ